MFIAFFARWRSVRKTSGGAGVAAAGTSAPKQGAVADAFAVDNPMRASQGGAVPVARVPGNGGATENPLHRERVTRKDTAKWDLLNRAHRIYFSDAKARMGNSKSETVSMQNSGSGNAERAAPPSDMPALAPGSDKGGKARARMFLAQGNTTVSVHNNAQGGTEAEI